MPEQLMTIDQVAEMLQTSARTVKRLNIPFSRIGKQRRYHPRDIEDFRKEKLVCRSSSGKARRSTTASSKSKAVDFFEALKEPPPERPRQKSAA